MTPGTANQSLVVLSTRQAPLCTSRRLSQTATTETWSVMRSRTPEASLCMHPRGQRPAHCLTFASSPNQASPRRYRTGYYQKTSLAAHLVMKYPGSRPPCRSVVQVPILATGRTGSQRERIASKAMGLDSCTESDPLERHHHPVPQTTTAFPVSTPSRRGTYRPDHRHRPGHAVLPGPAIFRYHHCQANKHNPLALQKLFPYHHDPQENTTALFRSLLHVT